MQRMIAVAVLGPHNLTRISGAGPLSREQLDRFADIVRDKEPGRTYYVVEVQPKTWKKKEGEPLYVWHVGEGFEHHEGWWVED